MHCLFYWNVVVLCITYCFYTDAESGPVVIVIVLAVLLTFTILSSIVAVIVVGSLSKGGKKVITKQVSMYPMNGQVIKHNSIMHL